MTYLVPADMRTASLNEACRQLDLTDDEAPNVQLTDAIERMSQRIDDYTNDHYEPEALVLTISGNDSTTLNLPRRTTAVTQVRMLDTDGTFTIEPVTTYRLHSSLESVGSRRKRESDIDYLQMVPGQVLSGGLRAWPSIANSVEVTGTFGWTTCPGDIKRAVALMVFDHFKPIRADLRRTLTWRTEDASMDASQTTPTGIPAADEIIAEFSRQPFVGVG